MLIGEMDHLGMMTSSRPYRHFGVVVQFNLANHLVDNDNILDYEPTFIHLRWAMFLLYNLDWFSLQGPNGQIDLNHSYYF